MLIEIAYRRQGRGRPPKCPVCKRSLENEEPRIETFLYGNEGRQFHLDCARALSEKIIELIDIEQGVTHHKKD